jgi:hypothetical protein
LQRRAVIAAAGAAAAGAAVDAAVNLGSSVAGAGGVAASEDHEPLRLLAHEGCRERIGEWIWGNATNESAYETNHVWCMYAFNYSKVTKLLMLRVCLSLCHGRSADCGWLRHVLAAGHPELGLRHLQ